MKKVGLLLAALLVSLNFYGQAWDNSKPDKRVTFGIRAGANLATMTDSEDYYEYKSVIKFQGGINTDINFTKSFAVETGVFYSLKGAKTDGGWRKKIDLGYVQVPIMALGRLYLSESTHLQIKAGPYFGVKAHDRNYFTFIYFDAGVSAGAGISVQKFYVGLQYDLGLLNVHGGHYKENKMYNRNLSLSVGYDF